VGLCLSRNPVPSLIIDPYADAQFERNPGGAILVDGVEVAHTVRCVHGGEQFVSRRGSGIRRGYCMRCGGVTCGHPAHDACIHWERGIELMEKR